MVDSVHKVLTVLDI